MAPLPDTPAEVLAWLRRFHDVHDSLQGKDFHKVYAETSQLTFGNYPTAEGLDAIKQLLLPSFAQLAYMKHIVRRADKVGDTIWCAQDIAYRVKDDPENEEIIIPAAGLLTLFMDGEDAGKVKRFDVFLDNAPVRQKMEAVSKR
ncbi:hypothetical protein LZ32DRAFT_600917 [Colletotrichum eremochloae]|nr:hypothetical protein LZ32DRAFT_600917 [Colletotrichum eremochloae]